jgi:hypothetical protein
MKDNEFFKLSVRFGFLNQHRFQETLVTVVPEIMETQMADIIGLAVEL